MQADPDREPITLADEDEFHIGPLLVRPRSHEVLSDGEVVRNLEPRMMQVLIALHRAAGDVVSRDSLIASCWNGQMVSSSAIQRCIAGLRKVGAAHDAFTVQVITKTGYRLRLPASEFRKSSDNKGPTPQPVRNRPSLAVLPFRTIVGKEEQRFLADGIQEALIAALSRIRSFFVISRNSTLALEAGKEDIIKTGQAFGVSYLIEGSLVLSDERIRVIVEMAETRQGNVIWASVLEGRKENIFELHDKVTEQVAGQLQPSIQRSEIERISRKGTDDLNAYELTMQALAHVWMLEREECEQALGLLSQALDRSPDYPLALALSAWCLVQKSVYNWTGDPARQKTDALKLAEQAASHSTDDPLVLTILGTVHSILRNRGTARVLLERARSLDPNSAFALQRLGWLEVYSDNPHDAVELFELSLRLSPYDPMNFNVLTGMGSASEADGDYAEAARLYEQALGERPHAFWIYRHLASALYSAGKEEEAKAAASKLIDQYPNLTARQLRDTLAFSPRLLDQVCDNLSRLGLPG